jgi:TIM-barrel protein
MNGDEPPRVVLASLSGESDAEWAVAGAEYADCAILGGIALCERSRQAAREMVADRDREEFLPADPMTFVDRQLEAVHSRAVDRDLAVGPGFNLRSTDPELLAEAAAICADHDAIAEINAHCRQDELRAVGCGESLLADTGRLRTFVERAVATGADVSVKVRAEVPGVDLPATASALADSGADAIHVDAMDSEAVIAEVVEAAPELFVIANNGVRDRPTVGEYLAYGADAVSVGRPSDDPTVLERVRRATDEWFAERAVSR